MKGNLVLPLILFLSVETTSTEKPNIILMMADDLGYGDVVPNDANTPNLQRLFESGLAVTDYHSAAPVCTPSRAGLLTGRLAQRTGVISNFAPTSVAGLPLTELTLGNFMQSVGYETGIIGKWHLGHTQHYNPVSRGFDYWYGLPYSNDMGCTFTKPAYVKRANRTCSSSRDLGIPIFENYDIVEQPANLSTLSERYEEKATTFMSNALKKQHNFFLYFPMTLVHVPLTPAKQFQNRSSKGHFGDTIQELDHTVGVMLDFIESKGIRNNTLFIFTSDNGPWELECEFAGTAGDYQGTWQRTYGEGGSASKMTTWEGGHRVPFIISWPNVIKHGTYNGIVSAFDIVPSFSKIAGFQLPHDRAFDGIVFPFLEKEKQVSGRVLFLPDEDDREMRVLRWGDYKVYYGTNTVPDCSGSTGSGFRYHNPALVFDLKADPAESMPVSVSREFYSAVEMFFNNLRHDISKDFTSSVDYRVDNSVRPCCNPKHLYCSCISHKHAKSINLWFPEE